VGAWGVLAGRTDVSVAAHKACRNRGSSLDMRHQNRDPIYLSRLWCIVYDGAWY